MKSNIASYRSFYCQICLYILYVYCLIEMVILKMRFMFIELEKLSKHFFSSFERDGVKGRLKKEREKSKNNNRE